MTRRRVVALQHDPLATLGWLGDVLGEHRIDVDVIDVRAGASVPQRADCDALVSLGADFGVYEEDSYPWLVLEKELIRTAVQREVPVLGICLGAQMIADALGGRTYRAPEPEIGFLELTLTEEGGRDPVLRHWEGPTLLWHEDTFDLPPCARLLATSARYPQAFRAGSGLGLQFHPETSPQMLHGWVDALGRDRIDSVAERYAGLVSQGDRLAGQLRKSAWRLFAAWLDDAAL